MSKKAKKSKMDLYYMKNGQAKNKTIIEEKERKKKEKEREKRIKEKKQETLKDEFDLETETVLQMTNRNRIKKSSINPNKKVNEIIKEERRRLVKLLKEFIIEIKGFRPIEEAIITSGGINIKEINPKTMESKKIKGLYFAGEIIDVDAYTGGFNLQIAYSTGYVAGMTHEGQV